MLHEIVVREINLHETLPWHPYLLHCVPPANGDAIVSKRIKVKRHAQRRANFVLSAITTACKQRAVSLHCEHPLQDLLHTNGTCSIHIHSDSSLVRERVSEFICHVQQPSFLHQWKDGNCSGGNRSRQTK